MGVFEVLKSRDGSARERGASCRTAFVGLLLGLGCAVGSEEQTSHTSFFTSAGNDGPSGSGDDTPTGTSISATASASETGDASATSDTSADSPSDGSDSVVDSTGSTGTPGPAECGNGVVEGDEGCDGADHGGQSCADFGFDEGILTCTPRCALVTETCWTCGDDMGSFMEVCDGTDLGGETCQSQGFGGGTLACNTDCQGYDTSGCQALPSCGDATVNGGEQCDGSDLGGHTCQSEGFDLGQIACTGNCTLDTSGCDFDPQNCGQMGDFCVFDENNPQSTCCPPGVGGNVFGICDIFLCI